MKIKMSISTKCNICACEDARITILERTYIAGLLNVNFYFECPLCELKGLYAVPLCSIDAVKEYEDWKNERKIEKTVQDDGDVSEPNRLFVEADFGTPYPYEPPF